MEKIERKNGPKIISPNKPGTKVLQELPSNNVF
jgi:hypothetical protein